MHKTERDCHKYKLESDKIEGQKRTDLVALGEIEEIRNWDERKEVIEKYFDGNF